MGSDISLYRAWRGAWHLAYFVKWDSFYASDVWMRIKNLIKSNLLKSVKWDEKAWDEKAFGTIFLVFHVKIGLYWYLRRTMSHKLD